MLSNILVAMDGSKPSRQALEMASLGSSIINTTEAGIIEAR